jgi:hypothetical protein
MHILPAAPLGTTDQMSPLRAAVPSALRDCVVLTTEPVGIVTDATQRTSELGSRESGTTDCLLSRRTFHGSRRSHSSRWRLEDEALGVVLPGSGR